MSQYLKTMTSFSGADLVVNFGKRVIGELQSISWAIQRKKAPVFTLGSSDARSFARGVRGIAGSLVFAVFDRDSLIEEMGNMWEDIAPPAMYTAAGNIVKRNSDDFSRLMDLVSWDKVTSGAAADKDGLTVNGIGGNRSFNNVVKQTKGNTGSNVNLPVGFDVINFDNIVYADMLPPFDITLTFANEYGQAAFQKIYDVDILNEGSGVSVDSIVMERQMTFIARRISPLAKGIYDREADGTIKTSQPY